MMRVFQGKIRPLSVEGLMMPGHVLSDWKNHTLYSPLLLSLLLPQTIIQVTIRQFHNDCTTLFLEMQKYVSPPLQRNFL